VSKVEEILQAIRALGHEEYLELRQAMDEMDKAEWEAERARAARDWAASSLTDDDIDAAVMRLRYEGRP
jgi:uncharacterized membrane protein